jgi:hypothetical protein
MHITCSRDCKERSHIYCWWVWRCLCWHPMPVKFRSRSCRRHDYLTIETTFPHHFPEFSAFCSIASSSSLSSHSPPWMKSLCVCVCVCVCVCFRVLGLACFPRSQRRTMNISSSNICEQNLLQSRDTREFAVSYWKQHHHGKNLKQETLGGHEDSLSTKKNTHTNTFPMNSTTTTTAGPQDTESSKEKFSREQTTTTTATTKACQYYIKTSQKTKL